MIPHNSYHSFWLQLVFKNILKIKQFLFRLNGRRWCQLYEWLRALWIFLNFFRPRLLLRGRFRASRLQFIWLVLLLLSKYKGITSEIKGKFKKALEWSVRYRIGGQVLYILYLFYLRSYLLYLSSSLGTLVDVRGKSCCLGGLKLVSFLV